MTFNVRGSIHEGDGINAWNNRAALNVETLKRQAPHVIGFQEVQSGNLVTYEERIPEYGRVLGPRAGDKAPHEFNAIFFDPARLELLDSGGFWLSTTPDRYSSSWRTRSVRCANWATLRCLNTDLSFLHLNTHLDHGSGPARVAGSSLILRKIAEIRKGQENDPPTIVTGDFNCAPGSPPHRTFTEDGFVDTYLATGNGNAEEAGTFHAFRGVRYPATRGGYGSGRIDWILVKDPRRRIRTKSHLIVRDCDEETGIYPSDHYPVLAELALPTDNGKTNGSGTAETPAEPMQAPDRPCSAGAP
jgi:endonuclease/exonuclease/phosphatase family metal-dependent hydrolase